MPNLPEPTFLLQRINDALARPWRALRGASVLNPTARLEMLLERSGHAVAGHRPHLVSAIDWLVRAQDATPDDGIARGYSVAYSPYWGGTGWQASYPETTGYIIPTLLQAARHLGREEYAARALRAARWEADIQLESGAVQGGVIGQGRSPAVFNTGQVMLGWLAAWEYGGDARFAEAARRAGAYLFSVLETDGHWRTGNSRFAARETTLYNARVAWALAEVGRALNEPTFLESASRNLHAVAAMQHANGWFPSCCLTDPARPLLHTLAYTVRGMLEGARVLEDGRLLSAGVKAARALAETVRPGGFMAGRYLPDWGEAVSWSCLTGQVQMANNWMRLYLLTGERGWLAPVPAVLEFVKRTQNRTTDLDGLRGGIKGSCPMDGEYGRFEILNWATKYFADALMRAEQIEAGRAEADGMFRLA